MHLSYTFSYPSVKFLFCLIPWLPIRFIHNMYDSLLLTDICSIFSHDRVWICCECWFFVSRQVYSFQIHAVGLLLSWVCFVSLCCSRAYSPVYYYSHFCRLYWFEVKIRFTGHWRPDCSIHLWPYCVCAPGL